MTLRLKVHIANEHGNSNVDNVITNKKTLTETGSVALIMTIKNRNNQYNDSEHDAGQYYYGHGKESDYGDTQDTGNDEVCDNDKVQEQSSV
jgi:hypothetical protein